MESPGLESPMDGDEIFPCKGCGEILEEGKAFELAGNRWHLNCFRCNTCQTLLDSDANLLLLGDGSLICNNCTYSCHACGNKIEDLAILTGDQAFCAQCFRCRNCKRKIENLRYARTSQGIFCMSCHESLMARRKKKTRAAAAQSKAKEKDSILVDKSLPALPPNAVPQSAFSADREEPDASGKDTPTELSPRPRANFPQTESSSRSSSRRPRSPERSVSESNTKDSLTLPSTTYKNNRHSVISSASDLNGGDGESFFIPLALDPSPAITPTSKVNNRESHQPVMSATIDFKASDKDYFSTSKNSVRTPVEKQEVNSQASTPHIAFQDSGRQDSSRNLSSEYTEISRKTSQSSAASTPLNESRQNNVLNGSSSGGLSQSTSDRFRLQEVPKNKRLGISRGNSENEVTQTGQNGYGRSISGSSASGIPARKEIASSSPAHEHPASFLNIDNDSSRSSQESRSRDGRPSIDSSSSYVQTGRQEQTGQKSISRKEIPSSAVKSSIVSSSGMDTSSSSASSSDTPGITPTLNGMSILSPVHSVPSEDLVPPSRSLGRPTPQQKTSDTYIAPRVAPAPPTPQQVQQQHQKAAKGALGPGGEPISPKLPRWSSGGDFTMDEDMARILGTDEGSQSILRRVSNAVRHGRNNSETSSIGRHGHSHNHNRSISETARTMSSPRWPKTSIAEDTDFVKDIGSPMSVASPSADDTALLRRRLRNSEQRVADLEKQFSADGDVQAINKTIVEKRKTVIELRSQAELMIHQVEVLAGLVEDAKDSKQPISLPQIHDKSIADLMKRFDKLKDSMGSQVSILIEQRDRIEEEKNQMELERDRALIEFEQLSSKNAQLADLNNDLTHQIQEKFKAQSATVDSPRAPLNGLGIYTHHNKAKSNTSMQTDDATLRPSTASTGLQTIHTNNVYPQQMDQEDGMGSATVLSAPQVVNIRKGKANKFNWKKGSATVAKGVTKGFKGAFYGGQERNQWAGQPGDDIGMPYDTTVAPMESPGPNSMPRSGSNDPSRQGGGFGLFKKSATMPKPSMGGNMGQVPTEPPNKLFGSLLVDRAAFERCQLPGIVTRCIEEVVVRGMDVEGIYRKTGGAGQVKAIQEGFEQSLEYDDISDPDMDITAVTSALKQYLRKLPIPLLTFDIYDDVMKSRFISNDHERCDSLRDTFDTLPAIHRDCLEYLIFHLNQVSEKSAVNKMTPKNLAVVFAPTIMRVVDIQRELTDANPRNDVIEFVIENCHEIFIPG